MAEESFMLISLKETKAKKLAQVISNETCRKILEHLSHGETTETELSKQLNLPISTVHYNLQNLVENKLVFAEEFHYSQKGKEVLHYKLANKLIIIAPAETDKTVLEKLKSFLPIGAVIIAATFGVAYLRERLMSVSNVAVESSARMMQASPQADTFAAGMAQKTMAAVPEMAPYAAEAADSTVSSTFFTLSNIAIWFLIGSIFSLAVYFIVEKFKKSKAK